MTEKTIRSELHSIGNLLRRISENSCICRYQRKTGLTETQSRVIGYLYYYRDRDIFQKDIEKEFSIRRATVSVLLGTLERKGFITRESVDYDARLKKVVLTEKSIEIASEVRRDIHRFEEMLKEGISEEDIDVFYRVVETIRQNIEKNFIDETEMEARLHD